MTRNQQRRAPAITTTSALQAYALANYQSVFYVQPPQQQQQQAAGPSLEEELQKAKNELAGLVAYLYDSVRDDPAMLARFHSALQKRYGLQTQTQPNGGDEDNAQQPGNTTNADNN